MGNCFCSFPTVQTRIVSGHFRLNSHLHKICRVRDSLSELLRAEVLRFGFTTLIILSNHNIAAIEVFQEMHAVSSSSCASTCGKLIDPGNFTNMLHRFAKTDGTSNRFVAAHYSMSVGVGNQISVIRVQALTCSIELSK